MTHPTLQKTAISNTGIYMTKSVHKNKTDSSSIHIGDPYLDTHKRSKQSSRFGGKQLQTNPSKNTSGDIGHFDKKKYSSEPYIDKTNYQKGQPLDARKLGFGSRDASRSDEFTTTVRTEQYREQLKCEATKVNRTQPDSLDAVIEEMPDPPQPKPKKKFLYDIGRNQNTEFDAKSPKDTWYNALECKSRERPERNNGPHYVSSQAVGSGTIGLDHSTCKPAHGHVKATKAFLDRSHLSTHDE